MASNEGVERSLSRHQSRGFCLPEDGIDFLQDKPGHQTFGRRIATYLSQFAWYNPQLNEPEEGEEGPDEKPSIAKAWAFFEHVTLNRYEMKPTTITNEGQPLYMRLFYMICRGDRQLEMAEPGENTIPTKLYSALHTPLSQLGDFGLGYGLYFSTLRSFAVLAFLAGIINLPNQLYFGSEEYSPGKEDLSPFLQGSAICTDRSWVPCPNCTFEQFEANAYPTNSYIWGLKTIGGEGHDWLDVGEYFWIEEVEFEVWELFYTDESLERLYEDYKIRYNPEIPASFDFEGYGVYDDCFYDCYWDIVFCDNDVCRPYLDLTLLENKPPYGDSELFHFAERSNCDGATKQAASINLATLFFFLIGVFVIRRRQKAILVKFDEDEQTAQDYSLNVLNPPEDAHDPDEWKEFFEKNIEDCHVTVVTVDMDNDTVLKEFIQRREILRQLEIATPDGTPLDLNSLEQEAIKAEEEDKKKGCLTKMISPSIPNLVERLKEVEVQIRAELKKDVDYPVTNIFVTFETEKAQRAALSALSVGSLAAHNNDTTALSDPKYLFRGQYVLEVDEPEEPSSIRWQELNATKTEIVTRLVITNVITAILCFIAILIVYLLYFVGPFFATTVTTIFTSLFPMVAKWMTPLEFHRSESSRQKWMFIKIALFHIVMTAILFAIVTPFLATLDKKENSVAGLIPVVHGLFYSQILISPAIQLADPMGHLSRHFFAPRAKTQEAMNMNMRGSAIYLADRYANLIKFIFLMVWYCAIYPGAFFMGSIALFVVYFTDRFSLMRTWARTPQVGQQIADFARNYFTPSALVLMAVMSAYFWSGFPYDNLCEDFDTTLDPNYAGNWTIQFRGDDSLFLGLNLFETPDINANFTVESDAQVYQFCQQDLRAIAGRSFPPLPKWQPEGLEWMTDDQEAVLVWYGWISVVILGGVLSVFLFRGVRAALKAFSSQYKPVGEDMGKDYSKLASIDSYVPQKQSNFFAYPLLLCDLKDIDPNLFSWQDPDKPYSEYSVYNDIKDIIDPSEVKVKHVFSDVKHWPPR